MFSGLTKVMRNTAGKPLIFNPVTESLRARHIGATIVLDHACCPPRARDSMAAQSPPSFVRMGGPSAREKDSRALGSPGAGIVGTRNREFAMQQSRSEIADRLAEPCVALAQQLRARARVGQQYGRLDSVRIACWRAIANV